MRTREKPPCSTYEKIKKKKTTLRHVKNRRRVKKAHADKSTRQSQNNSSDKSTRIADHSITAKNRRRHIRRLWLKCTLSAAVFTLTLTAAAGWQILKPRINSWQDFSAKATTLLLSDANVNKKLLPQAPKSSSDLPDAEIPAESFPKKSSDAASQANDPSSNPPKPDAVPQSEGSTDADAAAHTKNLQDTDAAAKYESDHLVDSVIPSDSFAAPDAFESSDSDIIKREQLADTTADTEEVEHIASVSNDWNLILVNPWNPIPDNYEITLAPLPNGHYIDQRCYNELMEMLEDCRAAGLSPLICSSYRTQEKQVTLFQERMDELAAQGYPKKEARKKAAASVARPGTSEHQAGLAVDLVDSSYQFLNSSQEHTQVQQWLMENSWKYGFILRYPSEKSAFTGIIYEPWHYRYVGKEAAEEIYKRGICLEEYLAEHFE